MTHGFRSRLSITGDEIGLPTPCNYRQNRPLAIAGPPEKAMSSCRSGDLAGMRMLGASG
jgi:hypothetical protein